MSGYLVAFGLTVAIELAVAILFDRKSRRLWLAVVGVNLFTHPMFGALLWLFPNLRGVPSVPIIEVVIILVEGFLLTLAIPERKWSWLFGLSLCMNATSYLAGVLIYRSWG